MTTTGPGAKVHLAEEYREHLRDLLGQHGTGTGYVPERSPVVLGTDGAEVVYVDRDGRWHLRSVRGSDLDDGEPSYGQDRDDRVVCAGLDANQSLCNRGVEPGRNHCTEHRRYLAATGPASPPHNTKPDPFLHRTSTAK